MSHHLLIIGAESLADIARLIAHAEKHPFTLAELKRQILAEEPPVGDDPAFVCHLPVGFRIVFSIEEQPGIGWCRHIFISVKGVKGAMPSREAVAEIMGHFGFRDGIENTGWIENEHALNFIEPTEAEA